MRLNREQAWNLLTEYNKTDSLLKHALTVEGVMRHFANLFGEEDIDKWAIIGLLHDLDYEKYPEQHCIKVQEILRERNIDEDYIHGIASHGFEICCDIEPIERMELVLYTIDELTGLITAAALMRPSKSVMDIELKSVKKKYKDKRFAAGVDRSIIEKGASKLGMDLDTVINETILGMREVAEAIGLGNHEE
ncbi:putative hydrolase (HD superfamily) [Mobilisporobacter senegalensis]|uniref:Putative hydrolase (HD superfamily) n=1 Tax=Mobilisporobacter senegalensis TaxID=1329262 RepID=A0A3N1XTZ2_9FIRM|nr:HD domain-containing protein [Mobilisporobacter senegalensis]ROR28337.1 putative hydrolase (HD superfamily) [Mobilisporobacter senegalensis]